MVIIPMTVEHVDQVLIIERECFITPWLRSDFLYEIESNPFGYYFCITNELNEVLGFMGCSMLQDQCQITTFAIDKKYQNNGLGSKLLEYFIQFALNNNQLNITLEVRVSNNSAISLYKKFSFKQAAIRKNYYQDNFEDAYLMIREL